MGDSLSIRGGVSGVIALAVSLIVAASIIPTALTTIATAVLTSVNAAVITVWQVVLPIIAVVAILFMFLGKSA